MAKETTSPIWWTGISLLTRPARNGRRYYLHFDVGGLAFPRDGYRLPHEGGDRLVVGDKCKTPLIQQAIESGRPQLPLAAGAVFHSDRGSNYTSCEFAKTLKIHDLRQSVGRTGDMLR